MASPQTTSNAAKGWAPDVVAIPIADAIPDVLLRTVTTVSGVIEGDAPSLLVPWVDDEAAAIVAEGAVIDEAEPTLSQVVVKTSKIAQLLRVSRELYGQQSTASLLSGSVARAITTKANMVLLQGDPAASVTGILDATDIQTTDPIAGDLDPLVDLVAAIESSGGQATHWVLAPDTWASLRKLRYGTDSNQNLLGAGTEDSERRLLSLPVIVSSAVPVGEGMVLDQTAVVSAAGQVMVATSQDVYFNSDSIGLRATLRVGSVAAKGSRLGKFSITAG